MGKYFIGAWDNWNTGERVGVNVPWGDEWTKDRTISASNQTIQSATADYGQYFDQTYLYFTTNDTVKSNLITQGFTTVFGSDYVNRPLYFSETNYVMLYQSGSSRSIRVCDAQGVISEDSVDTSRAYSLGGKPIWWNSAETQRAMQEIELRNVDARTFYLVITRMSSSSTQSYIDRINAFWENATPFQEDTDPYVDGGGSSGGGGGEGNFDDTSDTIPIPSLPSISGLNTGFFTAFVCTQSQLQNVSNYLWTDVISDILDTSTGLGEKVDALKKMVTSPYDAIMGCSLVPVSPPTGGSKEVKMYGVVKTGISLPYASSRWVEVDCGTLNIHEFWGSYLDYSPYTKTTSLYLPYIGVVSVDIDLIMAKALQVVYHVDILSGICIAYIVVDGSVKFQYQGHCSTSIPVTSSDFSGAIQSGLGLVGNIANVVSSGVSGGLSGGLGGAVLGATGSAISQAPSVASNVMGMKPDIKSGGGVGSSGGILGVQKPFLIIERPKQSVPAFQNGFSGYPCNMTKKLSDLTGYTEIERINLTNISLTEDEKNELLEILESGVYL